MTSETGYINRHESTQMTTNTDPRDDGTQNDQDGDGNTKNRFND